MSLFIAWVLFPLALGLLSLGAGMVVIRASGVPIPGVLVLPLGLALIAYDLLLRVPWPGEVAHWMAMGAAGLLTAGVLIICGKFLYDTLFFDRYWRQMDSR